MPPERIWLDPEQIAGHFANVKARRNAKKDSDALAFEDVEPMVENAAQAEEIRRLRGG